MGMDIKSMGMLPGEENIKYLYKYRCLIDNNDYGMNKNTINMLKSGELFFSKPRDFNDPFDCFIDEIVDGTDEEFMKYLGEKGKSVEYIDEILRQKNSGELNFKKLLEDDKSQDYFKVFCLSKKFDNILMWSHYADDHKGICIGFQIRSWKDSLVIKCKEGFLQKILGNNYLPLYHVTYDDNRPRPYNIIKRDRNMICDFIYTKGKCWEYEEEYRIILNDDILLQNPLCIEENEIKEVIFGLRTPDELKEKIVNIINHFSDNRKDVTIYEMIKKEGQYKLERERIR
jgi:hypothetical protein